MFRVVCEDSLISSFLRTINKNAIDLNSANYCCCLDSSLSLCLGSYGFQIIIIIIIMAGHSELHYSTPTNGSNDSDDGDGLMGWSVQFKPAGSYCSATHKHARTMTTKRMLYQIHGHDDARHAHEEEERFLPAAAA